MPCDEDSRLEPGSAPLGRLGLRPDLLFLSPSDVAAYAGNVQENATRRSAGSRVPGAGVEGIITRIRVMMVADD